MDECSFCRGEVIYFRPYSGTNLCRKCYIRSIERKVQRIISEYQMFRPDDRIAVAVSGGKDSLSLLYILHKIEEKFPRSQFVALTVNEGISGYREEAIEIAFQNCEELGIEHHVYSFKRLYGYSLDEIIGVTKNRKRLTPCSYCGILRRKALNLAAKDLNATKLVTAHNLDDETQSMMMNLLRGTTFRVGKTGPVLKGENMGFVPRVKPLCHLPEKEIAFYAFLNKINVQKTLCPYRESSMRSDVRRFLNALENKHPGIKFAFYRSFERIQPLVMESNTNSVVHQCEICNEPASGKICRSCQVIRLIKSQREEEALDPER